MNNYKIRTDENAFSILESVAAAVIVALTLTVAATAFLGSMNVSVSNTAKLKATEIATVELNKVRALSFSELGVASQPTLTPINSTNRKGCSAWSNTYSNEDMVILPSDITNGLTYCQYHKISSAGITYNVETRVTRINNLGFKVDPNSPIPTHTIVDSGSQPKRITIIVRWYEAVDNGAPVQKTYTDYAIVTPSFEECINGGLLVNDGISVPRVSTNCGVYPESNPGGAN